MKIVCHSTPTSTSRPTASGAESAPTLKNRWSTLSARPRPDGKRSRNRPFIPPSIAPALSPAGSAASRNTPHEGAIPSATKPPPWSATASVNTVLPSEPLGHEATTEGPRRVDARVQEVEDADPGVRLIERVLDRPDQRRDEQPAPTNQHERDAADDTGRGRQRARGSGHPRMLSVLGGAPSASGARSRGQDQVTEATSTGLVTPFTVA